MNREILVITSTKHPSTAAKVSGVYRYAKAGQWKVRVADMPADPRDIPDLLELWDPNGCIFEAGAAAKLPDTAAFARVKTVFLDADRRHLPKNAPIVIHDSEAIGRLEFAQLLLRQRHLPIADIAGRVGYDSVIAFDRFFKSRTGKSPTKWQENPYSANGATGWTQARSVSG